MNGVIRYALRADEDAPLAALVGGLARPTALGVTRPAKRASGTLASRRFGYPGKSRLSSVT
jgi:hypothetical protein